MMIKRLYQKIALIFSLLFLSACQSTLIKEDGRYIEVSSQASIEITESIEVGPNSARAFLQNGELIYSGQLNLYDVNCEIEINTVSEKRQTIEAGVFDIRSISQDQSPIVKQQGVKKEIMVASLGTEWQEVAWDSNSPVDIKRFYRFKLTARDSSSKSEVRSVTCRGAQDTPFNARLPSSEEMKNAGGHYLKFNF